MLCTHLTSWCGPLPHPIPEWSLPPLSLPGNEEVTTGQCNQKAQCFHSNQPYLNNFRASDKHIRGILRRQRQWVLNTDLPPSLSLSPKVYNTVPWPWMWSQLLQVNTQLHLHRVGSKFKQGQRSTNCSQAYSVHQWAARASNQVLTTAHVIQIISLLKWNYGSLWPTLALFPGPRCFRLHHIINGCTRAWYLFSHVWRQG